MHRLFFILVVDRSSQLLGIDSERLEAVMKEKTMKLRGEYITSPQSIDQVVMVLLAC